MAECPDDNEWRSHVASYIEYNRTFVINERKEVERFDVQRRSRPKKDRITKGELFRVHSIKKWNRTNTYEFFTKNLLPTGHSFQSGQTVELRSINTSKNQQRKDTVCFRIKGVLCRKESESSSSSILVEFYDNSRCSLFGKIRDTGIYHVAKNELIEIEIAVDTLTFDRMEDALRTISQIHSKPMWLVAAIASRLSKDAMKRMFNEHFTMNGVPDAPRKLNVASNLNGSQQSAIKGAMQTNLTLIQGPPGTGKTHTTAMLVDTWLKNAADDQVAFVVAQSNKAVDEMTRAISKCGRDPLRVGSVHKTHESVLRFHVMKILSEKIKSFGKENNRKPTTREQQVFLEGILQSKRIVCTTCSGVMNKILNTFPREKVGLVAMDEATQASEPECLIPLAQFSSAKVVFIGDQMQLPPTILSTVVRRSTEEYSLFGRLINMLPGSDCKAISNVLLNTQYRMHPAIAAFPNFRFYDNKLLNGVTSRDRKPVPPEALWPVVGNQKMPVLFIESSSHERKCEKTSYINSGEADIVVSIVKKLQQSGVSRNQIGVISPYTGQVQLLKRRLAFAAYRGLRNPSSFDLEVNSVDAFQGSEARDNTMPSFILTTCIFFARKRLLSFQPFDQTHLVPLDF